MNDIAEVLHTMFPEFSVYSTSHGYEIVAMLDSENEISKTIFDGNKNDFCKIMRMSSSLTLEVTNKKARIIFEIDGINCDMPRVFAAHNHRISYDASGQSAATLLDALCAQPSTYEVNYEIENRFTAGLKSVTEIINRSVDIYNIDFDVFDNDACAGGIITMSMSAGVIVFDGRMLQCLCDVGDDATSIMIEAFCNDGISILNFDFNFGD